MKYDNRSKGLILAGVTAFCWASLAIFLKKALTFTSTENIVAFRMLISFCILFTYFLVANRGELKKVCKNPPLLAGLAGLMLSFNYFGYMKGVEYTGAGNAQIMIQLGPTLLIVFGLTIFKESFSRRQIFGICLALLGFVLFYYDQKSFDINSTLNTGNLWILAAAITWAIYAVLQKKLTAHWNPQTLNLIIYFVCSLVLLPMSDLGQSLDFKILEWALIFFLGLNSLVAYGCLAEALKYAPASEVSLVITINPLGTLLILWLGQYLGLSWIPLEYITWIGGLGAMCVVLGVGWTLSQKKS